MGKRVACGSVLVAVVLGLVGCASTMDQSQYVNSTLRGENPERGIRDAAVAKHGLPGESRHYAKAVRLIGASSAPASSFSQPYRSRYGYGQDVGALKRLGLIDVAVRYDMQDDVPVYRFVLTPKRNVSAEAIRSWAPIARVAVTLGYNQRAYLYAPLPPVGERLVNGQVVTPWTFCPACIAYSSGQSKLSDDDFMREFKTRAPRLIQGSAYRGIDNLGFVTKAEGLTSGVDAAAAARQAFVQRLAGHGDKRVAAAEANRRYTDFINNTYKPRTMAAALREARCGSYRTAPNINQNAEYNRREITANERYIRCAGKVADAYDFAAYTADWPELEARETALWEQTYGIERKALVDPEGQLAYARSGIEEAYAGIDNLLRYANAKEAQYARKQRSQQAMMTAFQNANRNIQTMMAETRDRRVVVTPEGYVSTVGEERRRALERARVGAHKPHRRSDAKKPRRPDRRDTAPNTAAAADSAADAATPDVAQSESAPATGDSNAAPPMQVATAEAAAPVAAAEPAPEAEAEVERTAPVPEPEVEPISGGMQGCVQLVETIRHPGKSALSSCTYDEPERMALTLKFRNACGVPVHVMMDLLYDTGETEEAGEYNIGPGRTRTSVGFCGATKYSYSYEETSESVSKRSE